MATMEQSSEARRRWAALLGGAAALWAMLAHRLAETPVAEWGSNGTAWAEHAGRLSWLVALRQNATTDDPLGPLALLRAMESGFPAGLYLVGVALEPVVGASAEAVAWTGLLWLPLLAWGVGAVAAALGARRSLGAVAALGVLMVPALPASALRYYFDLPMTALVWASAGAIVCWPRPAGGLLAGLLAGAACVVKWTALPFVLPIWLGLALSRRDDGGARGTSLAALAVATATLGLVVGGYLAAVGGDNSLLAMADEARVGAQTGGVGGLFASTLRGLFSLQPEPGARLLFYLGTTVAGVLSPLGAGLLLAALVGWWRGGRAAWPLVAATVLGHAAVLFLLVRPADERFVLTGLPALVVVASLGWQGWTPTARRRFAVVAMAAMGAVAGDAHLGSTPLGRPAVELQVVPGGGPIASQTLRLRGLGMASSFQGRGWYRRDEVPAARAALREATWRWLLACGAPGVRVAIDAPTVHDEGDQQWFGYRSALADWRGEPGQFALSGFGCEEAVERAGAVWLQPSTRAGNQQPPPCPADADWALIDVVEDPDGGAGVAAWSAVGAGDCAALRGGD